MRVTERSQIKTAIPAALHFTKLIKGDAANIPLQPGDADIVVTSPPYWQKRDYGFKGQLGQEKTPDQFIEALVECMREWWRILPSWGSAFVNIGDTYENGSLVGIPSRLEIAAKEAGWVLRNRIIWVKSAGMPDPAQDRLKSRHEPILHFTKSRRGYYYDQFGYAQKYGNGTGPVDIWEITMRRNLSRHLAPYPEELVDRCLTLACPSQVSIVNGEPRRRMVERTTELNMERPQARRAKELSEQHGLTDAHLRAIRSTGISDVGKATKTQTGTGKNSSEVQRLAAEAKTALGGYFREFTFGKRKTVGWTLKEEHHKFRPGIVLDPFVGTGTTIRAANALGLSSIGVDMHPEIEKLCVGNSDGHDRKAI